MSLKSLKFPTSFLFSLLFLATVFTAKAQIYSHNFGTTTFSAHPYTVAPTILNPNLSNSSWTNSEGAWTSTTGASGQAIRLTGGNSTISLTFNINPLYKVDITSFNFWRVRNNAAASNWSMTINGINVGSGTTPTTGAAIGNTPVATAVSGLRGTVTVVISLTGATGTGTFRLDDFTLNGNVILDCSAATISSLTPATGPQNTLVTINGSGFQAGTGTSAVAFNGVPSTFTVISDTKIEAYVPAGNATGNITVTTNGCPGTSTIPFTKIVSDVAINYSSDIYISELYDEGSAGGITEPSLGGDGGIIELYNGTASAVNLNGYTIKRYGDIGGSSFYTITLTGTIQPGQTYLIKIGNSNTRCSYTHDLFYQTGFNENDEFELLKNNIVIDNVHVEYTAPGYTIIRKPDAIAPKVTFNRNDWNTTNQESCANIGMHNVAVPSLPTVTHPVSKTVCESASVIFTAPLSNPAGFTFQWKVVNAFGVWSNIVNNAQYSGATTNTLTINSVPLNFNKNQYYCEMTATGKKVVSNAAQLEVSTGIIPNFPTTLRYCSGETVSALNTTSPNGIVGTWSPATISNTANGRYVFTPNVGQCATPVTLDVTIDSKIIPNFSTSLNLCNGQSAPPLNTTSPNGISGTWLPAIIDNTTNASYTFTPNAGQCAEIVNLNVTIGSLTTPNFSYATTYCQGATVPVLANVSPNGITGTWSPATISNTGNGIYTFTPNAGQCATTQVLNIAITTKTIPDFPAIPAICTGGSVPTLATTSPNGITGTWSPATISNTGNGIYTFTPNAGQCAETLVLNANVGSPVAPNFVYNTTVCENETVQTLQAVSPNGITGTWSPATISNTTNGIYTFTPNAGQCATAQILTVTITRKTVPNFAVIPNICEGETAPVLANVSPNGITGTWSPAVIDNTANGIYTFTPNASECATGQTLTVAITRKTTPNFSYATTYCQGATVPVLANVSPNGIAGTWSPATISNTGNGIYTFTPNAGQCARNFVMNVFVNPIKTPDFVPTISLCHGDPAPALNTVSQNGIVGTWSPSIINNTADGTYFFTPNAGQCAVGFTLTVTINNGVLPAITGPNAVCENSTIQLANATASGRWSSSNTSIALVDSNGLVTGISEGVATISYSLITGNCSALVSKTIRVNALPKPVLIDKTICIDQFGTIISNAELNTGLSNNGTYRFSWTLNNLPLSTTGSIHRAIQAGTYKVIVTNLSTGCATSATAEVKVLSQATATASVGEDFGRNQIITVKVTGGSGDFEYQLNDGLPQDSNQFTGVYSGDYEIIVRDKKGCQDILLEVFALNYPRYFTPNGDGFHDTWNIDDLKNQAEAKIYIFDRYGKLIKFITPSSKGWDGTFNGQPLPSTDYWFKLLYKGKDGNDKEFKSHFSLKR